MLVLSKNDILSIIHVPIIFSCICDVERLFQHYIKYHSYNIEFWSLELLTLYYLVPILLNFYISTLNFFFVIFQCNVEGGKRNDLFSHKKTNIGVNRLFFVWGV